MGKKTEKLINESLEESKRELQMEIYDRLKVEAKEEIKF